MPEIEPTPIPPATKLSILTSKLRAAPLVAFKSVGKFNSWIASKFNISKKRVFQVEIGGLLAFGYTQMQIGEWAAAVLCWILLAFIIFAKAIAWEGVRGQQWLTTFLRSSWVLGAVGTCVLLVAITVLHKPESDPWSNLQKLSHKNKTQDVGTSQPLRIGNRDSLPFVMGAPLGDNDSNVWEMIVRHFGSTPSYDCDVNFSDISRKSIERGWRAKHPQSSPPPPGLKGESERRIHIPEFPITAGINFTWTPIDPNHQHYRTAINCRDGSYDEDWEVVRVQGILRTKITIERLSPWANEKPESVYSCVDRVSARPSEAINFKLQDRYAIVDPDWKPNHVFEFPVAIIPTKNNSNHSVFVMKAVNPGCWECLQGDCGVT